MVEFKWKKKIPRRSNGFPPGLLYCISPLMIGTEGMVSRCLAIISWNIAAWNVWCYGKEFHEWLKKQGIISLQEIWVGNPNLNQIALTGFKGWSLPADKLTGKGRQVGGLTLLVNLRFEILWTNPVSLRFSSGSYVQFTIDEGWLLGFVDVYTSAN